MTSRPKLHVQQNELFCKNLCGFYGNPQWGGFCSKCYRELTQPTSKGAATTSISLKTSGIRDTKKSSVSASPLSDGVSSGDSDEKKKKTFGKGGIFRKMKTKASPDAKTPEGGAPQRTSNLSPESIQIHKALSEFLSSLPKQAAEDVRRQIQVYMEHCIEAAEVSSSDEMSDLVQGFYNTFHDRVHSHTVYQGVTSDQRAELEDLMERYLTTRLYRVLYVPLSQQLEEADLGIQKRIRSLYWVSAELLELNVDETAAEVNQLLESAITDIIEVDSKRTPQDKLACVSSCVTHLLEMLWVGRQSAPPSADDLLPAIIYVVLRANPPRLQSNVQYVTRFSSQQRIMSGQHGYYFTNLCCAVSFIDGMCADSLGLTEEEYQRYMSGEALPPAAQVENGQYKCRALRMLETSRETLTALQERQDRLLTEEQALDTDMDDFYGEVGSKVDTVLLETPLTLRPGKRPAQLDSPSTNMDSLPPPLIPQVLDSGVSSLGEAAGSPPSRPDLSQLPEPPPGLLSDAQDSLSSVINMSQMSLDPSSGHAVSAAVLPSAARQRTPPAESSSSNILHRPGAWDLPPAPPSPLSFPAPAPTPETGASNIPHRPGTWDLPPAPPSPPNFPAPLPPDAAEQAPPLPPRGVRSIPSIPCSTGGGSAPVPVPLPRPGHGQPSQLSHSNASDQSDTQPGSYGSPQPGSYSRGTSDLQQAGSYGRRASDQAQPGSYGRGTSDLPQPGSYSRATSDLPLPGSYSRGGSRRMSELPRSVSHTEAGPRRMSELPRSVSHCPAADAGRRQSLTRTEAMAEEARRFSQARAEFSRVAGPLSEVPGETAAPERRRQDSLSVGSPQQTAAAAATAAITAECEAARQRSRSAEKQDKLVKVLSGIFSLTDNL